MARISTYANDSTINDNDRLIGTDGGTGQAGTSGATKNFPIGDLKAYFASETVNTAIPVGTGSGYGTSIITQDDNVTPTKVTIDGDLCVNHNITVDDNIHIEGDIYLTGGLLDQDGNPVVINTDGSGMGTVNPDTYTTVVQGDNGGPLNFEVNAFEVVVMVQSGMITLPSNPPDGTWVKISNLAPQAGAGSRVIINGNGSHFMNTPGDEMLILDDVSASFELVYVNKPTNPIAGFVDTPPVGWVIIGAN